MGDTGFWRRVRYTAAELGWFVTSCLLAWRWLPERMGTIYFVLIAGFLIMQWTIPAAGRWLRVSNPWIRSEWLWPARAVDGPLGTLEIPIDKERQHRFGMWLIKAGVGVIGFASVVGIGQIWFDWKANQSELVIMAGIMVMLWGANWNLDEFNKPLVIVDDDGLKSHWFQFRWDSIIRCEIRSELNLWGDVTRTYPVFYTAERIPVAAMMRNEFSLASPEDCERLLALVRVRFVKNASPEAVR